MEYRQLGVLVFRYVLQRDSFECLAVVAVQRERFRNRQPERRLAAIRAPVIEERAAQGVAALLEIDLPIRLTEVRWPNHRFEPVVISLEFLGSGNRCCQGTLTGDDSGRSRERAGDQRTPRKTRCLMIHDCGVVHS